MSTSNLDVTVPSFGNGFVEIAMLTTLVGPGTAESMILGNHGAAGLAWATMSTFGISRVISACLSGACAHWLREIMGLRSKTTDSSLGMELSSEANNNVASIVRNRYAADGPLALVVDSRESSSKEQAGRKAVWREIYAFDDPTYRLIKKIPDTKSSTHTQIAPYKEFSVDARSPLVSSPSSTQSGDSLSSRTNTISDEGIILSVYTYAPYVFYRPHYPKFQLSMLALSFIKLGECSLLWWLSGRPNLSLATALPWMYFFTIAVIVEVNELRNARIPQDSDSYVDMLAGNLPRMTNSGAGGVRKVILGVTQNSRTTLWWKIMWGTGVLVCVADIIYTYIVLSQESNKILFIWFSLQVLWTFVRIVVHHFAEPRNNTVDDRMLAARSWSTLPSPLKRRVVKLMSTLASYLTLVHPRREIAYRNAAVAPEELRTIVFHTSPKSSYPLSRDISPLTASRKRTIVEIEINAVIGDPALSSAAWIGGAWHLTPTDLYDCCIISFRTYTSTSDSLPKLITIPCARVLSGKPVFSGIRSDQIQTTMDEEINTSHHLGPRQFVPKYVSNIGGNWCYFIPCELGLWIFFRQNIMLDVVGKHTAEVLTDMQVTAMLAEGDMNIGLSDVDDIKQTVDFSEQARQILLQILVP